MSKISHVGAYFTASILPDSLHDAEIRGAAPLSTRKKPSLLAGCDNRISTVSTTSNNQAMNESVRAVANQYLDGHEITEALLNHLEVAVRAYDPCLSCATWD